ncbi:S9 family peptidase [Saccharomonospora iraqiensis]|uniref:S9 family peptidase n=1 Tax=Saccharomonospora iraqiensis TaxID=52698 RepID=UPI0018EF5084|nr:prolyl oligopeptidase family serine peptidase [Saccharomonospora iraqiensis]
MARSAGLATLCGRLREWIPVTDDLSFLRRQARTQRFTLGIPKDFRVTPDGRRVLFLRAESAYDRRHSLFTLDLDTGAESKVVDAAALLPGEEELPPEERARRERTRESSGGVVTYAVDRDVTVAAFSLSGKLHTVDLADGRVTGLVDDAVVDPRPDPTGARVAYASRGALRVVERASGADHALVTPEHDDVTWGLAEFIAAEELSRVRGYWWAPDGRSLLVQRTDRSPVPRWTIADPANPDTPPTVNAYPAAGTTNAEVSLSFVGLDGSRVDVSHTDWEYLVAAHWSAGGPPLIAVMPRDQRRIEVYALDPADGSATLLRTETDPEWVEILTGVPAWTPDGRLVTTGVADGAHRLLIDGTPATPPELQLRAVLHVGDDVLFSASEGDPTQIHVYRTRGDDVERLSTGDGLHVGSGTAGVAVVSSWSLDHSGPRVSVLTDGNPVAHVDSYPADPGLEPAPEWLTVGERDLRAALLLPRGYDPGDGQLPVLLDPYGGPHAQRVLRSRNAFLTPQWLADQGFAVLVADGRGTPGRGPAWEKEIARDFAGVTLTDQVDALHAVASQYPGVLDLDRVAIRGWSYGGYLAALAVLRRPDVFHAAVAGAPVTDWALYDTAYTERYLGHPDEQPEVYAHNSLPADADRLRRPLMIVHGLADDNVFVAHSLRLSSALLAAGRAHTFLPLPGATHMTPQAEEVAENLMRTQVDWLKRELGAAGD